MRKPVEQFPVADTQVIQRYARLTRNGGSQTAPSSPPETHHEEEDATEETAAEETATAEIATVVDDVGSPSQPSVRPCSTAVKLNPVLVHVADYVSSDCVDDSDDQQSVALELEAMPNDDDNDGRPFPESSDEELPDVQVANRTRSPSMTRSHGAAQITASKSDGHIHRRRRSDELDMSTSSLNRQSTQCCMSFKTNPKSSRKKSQSHSCRLV